MDSDHSLIIRDTGKTVAIYNLIFDKDETTEMLDMYTYEKFTAFLDTEDMLICKCNEKFMLNSFLKELYIYPLAFYLRF